MLLRVKQSVVLQSLNKTEDMKIPGSARMVREWGQDLRCRVEMGMNPCPRVTL